jgi:hypothetical protein
MAANNSKPMAIATINSISEKPCTRRRGATP